MPDLFHHLATLAFSYFCWLLALPELLLAALAMEISTPPLVLVLVFRCIKGKEVHSRA